MLRVSGRNETTARFGDQFRVSRYTEVAPQTIEGMRRYLGSGLIKGIGPEFASRIVDRFGIETLEILDRDPGRISEVPGIGPSRARAIRTAWSAQREVRKVMVFLQGYGVSPAFAARIYKTYGAAAIARVRENPYRLAFDVWGIGFLSADKLAAALGIARDAPSRAEAGVRHVLDDEGGNGHVFVPRPRLAQKAAALLDLPEESVGRGDRAARQDGRRARSTRQWSKTRARPRSTRPGSTAPRRRSPPGCASCWPARRRSWRSIRRARSPGTRRRRASRSPASRRRPSAPRCTAKVVVITGGPGVGKTTIVRGIVSILGEEGRQRRAGGADRARRQAAVRGHRRAGVDAAPPAGVAPGGGGLRRATPPGRWRRTS